MHMFTDCLTLCLSICLASPRCSAALPWPRENYRTSLSDPKQTTQLDKLIQFSYYYIETTIYLNVIQDS